MNDVTVKFIRSKIASAVFEINGKEYDVNSSFVLLSKIYNEMYDTDFTFEEHLFKNTSVIPKRRRCKIKPLK